MKQMNALDDNWPKSNRQLAKLLGVSEGTIRGHQRLQRKELIEGRDYIRKDLGVPYAPTLMTVWTKEGAVKLAHYCKRSSRAREFLEHNGVARLHVNYIEGETIDLIVDAVDGFVKCFKQYSVDGYRVDLYLKDINLVVECDEHGHKYRNDVLDAYRQSVVEKKLNCSFLRFDPDDPGFRIGKIVNEIFKRIFIGQCKNNI